MAISSTTNRLTYTGDGATSVYPYTFRIFSEDHLLVTVQLIADGTETTLTKTTDYTVSGVNLAAGGNVTLVDAGQAWLDGDGDLLATYKIVIRRVVPLTQLTDIRNQGSFYPEAHEDEFDKSRQIDQQQQDELDRSFKLAETIDPANFDARLPASLASTPGAFLQVNAAADGMTVVDALSDSEVALPAGTGIMVRTGTTTAQLRTITGTANEIDVSNGNGVSGNPTLSMPAGAVVTAKLADGVFDGLTGVAAALDDYVPIADTSDSNNKKKVLVSSIKNSSVRSVSSTDTATTSDEVLVLSGASFTETLFTASGNTGKELIIVHNGTTGSQVYTIDGNGSETIGGATTYKLHTNGERIKIVSDGTNWIILDKSKKDLVVRAQNTAGSGLGAAAETLIPFATEDIDTHGAWATDTFTVPWDGKFRVGFKAVHNVFGAGYGGDALRVKVNTTIVSEVYFGKDAATSVVGGGQLVDVLDVSESDTIKFYYYESATGKTLVTTAETNTIFIESLD